MSEDLASYQTGECWYVMSIIGSNDVLVRDDSDPLSWAMDRLRWFDCVTILDRRPGEGHNKSPQTHLHAIKPGLFIAMPRVQVVQRIAAEVELVQKARALHSGIVVPMAAPIIPSAALPS